MFFVSGSLNTNNEPCTAPSRLTLDNKKPTVSSNIENDSSHERNSEQQTETGISNLGKSCLSTLWFPITRKRNSQGICFSDFPEIA